MSQWSNGRSPAAQRGGRRSGGRGTLRAKTPIRSTGTRAATARQGRSPKAHGRREPPGGMKPRPSPFRTASAAAASSSGGGPPVIRLWSARRSAAADPGRLDPDWNRREGQRRTRQLDGTLNPPRIAAMAAGGDADTDREAMPREDGRRRLAGGATHTLAARDDRHTARGDDLNFLWWRRREAILRAAEGWKRAEGPPTDAAGTCEPELLITMLRMGVPR